MPAELLVDPLELEEPGAPVALRVESDASSVAPASRDVDPPEEELPAPSADDEDKGDRLADADERESLDEALFEVVASCAPEPHAVAPKQAHKNRPQTRYRMCYLFTE